MRQLPPADHLQTFFPIRIVTCLSRGTGGLADATPPQHFSRLPLSRQPARLSAMISASCFPPRKTSIPINLKCFPTRNRFSALDIVTDNNYTLPLSVTTTGDLAVFSTGSLNSCSFSGSFGNLA